MSRIENKNAYPYITHFKKEPFKSFLFVEEREIGYFYIRKYKEVTKFYQFYESNLLSDSSLNLENIYWFLLIRKFIKAHDGGINDKIYEFVKKCEVSQGGKIGFKFFPTSQKTPDIWSTYFALAIFKLLGLLKEYLFSKDLNQNQREIKNFVLAHKKGNRFLHCLKKDCEIDNKTSPTRTLYFVIEIFMLLGADIRTNREQFCNYVGERKKNPALVFKLLCLKLLGLDAEVKDKEIQFLFQYQKENGGYSFKKINGNINTSFWVVYVLQNYSWICDYNPVGVYSFINSSLNEILSSTSNLSTIKLMELSKLIIILSHIWVKFIEEIERLIFKNLEQNKYVDVKQLITKFGLTHGIEEVISYINLSYTVKLRILDNKSEIPNYIRNLNPRFRAVVTEIFKEISKTNIISLSDIVKKNNLKFRREAIKIKDIRPVINEMLENHFFEGNVRVKKRFLAKPKYYLYLDLLLEKIIVSDSVINTETIYEEKEKLNDIRNDIYNMTLKLKNVTSQIKEEIESYLLLDEIAYAKGRLKFVLRDTLMDADFLNENIENSFNEILYYVNFQAVLGAEISQWKKLYSVLSKRLNEIDSYLKEKIQEKEELIKYNKILEDLDNRLFTIEQYLEKEIESFKKLFRNTLEEGYTEEKFNLILEEINKLSGKVGKYDRVIFRISQKITLKEEKLIQKHKKIIANWLSIKSEFDELFDYYLNGFQFFKNTKEEIDDINFKIRNRISAISEKAKGYIKENDFQEAFNIIKKESDIVIKEKSNEIKEFRNNVKKEIKQKQKLFLLYRYLQEKLEKLEESTISLVAEQVQSLKEKVIEERNRAIIEDFDNFVSRQIGKFKVKLDNFKNELIQQENKKVKELIKELEVIETKFNKSKKKFLVKLDHCKKVIENFDEKENVTVIQYEKFEDFFKIEIDNLKDESINRVINNKISQFLREKKTNNIKLEDLKKEVNLKCSVLIDRIKDMIEISKINGKLYEKEKCVVIFTEEYYKNKELRSFVDNKLIKFNNETIGKILALYDSCIRNRTLSVNMLEIQNRIKDLKDFEIKMREQFNAKLKEFQIQIESREDYIKTKQHFDSILENNRLAIDNIYQNTTDFQNLQNFIGKEYDTLKMNLIELFDNLSKEIESSSSYIKIIESFKNKKAKFEDRQTQIQSKIEERLTVSLNENFEAKKFAPEIREYFVKIKNSFFEEYEKKEKKFNEELLVLKTDVLQEKLIAYINTQKIHVSQLLGTLQSRVEDDVEIKEYRRAYSKIQKRAKIIENEIKIINKNVKNLVRNYKRELRDFETKNKYILDDFDKFIRNFDEVLSEKIRSLERLILKSYVEMAIKAVANEYLTIGFLNNELRIKRQNIQNHFLSLISSGDLEGKYDPRLGIYYENAEVLERINENELEVIKKMDFKVYMFLNRLKNFTGQYYSIIAFFASILTISYYLFVFSGNNPLVIAFPIIIFIALLSYVLLKKKRGDKTKV